MTVPQIQNDPIYLLPLPQYINGLNINICSSTVLSIAPGQARDSKNMIDMPVGWQNLEGNVYPAPLGSPPASSVTNYYPTINPNGYGVGTTQLFPNGVFINSAVIGANGLDQGTLAASSFYCVYLIGDSRNNNPTAGLLSLYSNAFPLLPSGYDSYRLLGFVQTSSGTAFEDVLNYKNGNQFMLQPEGGIVAGGNATSFTAEALTTYVPTTTDEGVVVVLDVYFTPAAVGDTVQFRPTGSSATGGLVTVSGIAAGVPQQQYVQVIAGVSGGEPSIDYKVSSSSDSVTWLVNNYTVTTS